MINLNIGLVYLNQRHYDKALDEFKKIIEMDQTFSQAHYQMAKAHGAKKMYEETIAEPWSLLPNVLAGVSGTRQ